MPQESSPYIQQRTQRCRLSLALQVAASVLVGDKPRLRWWFSTTGPDVASSPQRKRPIPIDQNYGASTIGSPQFRSLSATKALTLGGAWPNSTDEFVEGMFEGHTSFYPLAAGDLVGGKYRINGVIGEGGMGVVFAATHLDLQRTVALKVIRSELSQQPELIARLMLEARAAAQIRSEHVCHVLDVARLESGIPYVVMEYLEGKNLSAVLDAKVRLSDRVAVDYILQACEALAEAHRAGIVHRDLKPENLFLAELPDGRRLIKVLDFGISKTTGQFLGPGTKALTNPTTAMGSPHYMAPEQMAAARDVDARADIWALGAILHQLVTGHLAFDGTSLPAVCAAVLQSEPVPVRNYVADVSPGLERAILTCLVKNRDQRLTSVAELAHSIAPFGSTNALQSATRISRLLENTSPTPDSHDASGTLLSPRQLPTPRTPLRQQTGATTQAVTSSKKSFTVPDTGDPWMTRRRGAVIGLLTLVGLGLAGALLVFSRGTGSSPVHESPLDGTSSANAVGAPTVVPAAQLGAESSVALGQTSLPSGSTSLPAQPSGTAQVNRDTPESQYRASSAIVATARERTRADPLREVTRPQHAATPTLQRKNSASKDPYDPNNFGGRR